MKKVEETVKQLELILKARKEHKTLIENTGRTCENCNPDINALTNSIEFLLDYEKVLKENEELKDYKERTEYTKKLCKSKVEEAEKKLEKMKNSREEDIKIVENYLANSAINEKDSNFFKNVDWEIVDLEIPKSMQHILSDYKRVLEINKVLLKENEKIKEANDYYSSRYCEISNNSISIQKVKDKIEEINNEKLNYSEDDWYLESEVKGYAIDKLKEIESEE